MERNTGCLLMARGALKYLGLCSWKWNLCFGAGLMGLCWGLSTSRLGLGPARAYVKLILILDSFPWFLVSWCPPLIQCKEINPFPAFALLPCGQTQGFGVGMERLSEQSTETQTRHNLPQKMGAWLCFWFSSFICHWLGAAIVAKGTWGVHHHTQENGMKSTKIRKPLYNIIAVNY